MKTQRIEGVTVLAPETSEQLLEAVNSGRPFLAPPDQADEIALHADELDPELHDILHDDGQPSP